MQKIIILLCLFLYSVNFVYSTQQVENLNSSATIIAPLTITQESEQSFGNIMVGSTDTVFNLNHSKTTVTAGNGQYVGGMKMGQYKVTGQPNTTVYLSVTPTGTITYNGNTLNVTYAWNQTYRFIDADGSIIVSELSSTLTVPANSPSGNYTGNFNITVNY